MREVPDNQEVWASTESDESLIVEIVEPPEAADDLAVGRFFFEDILDQNDAHADGLFSLDSIEVRPCCGWRRRRTSLDSLDPSPLPSSPSPPQRLSPSLTPHLPSGAYAVGVVGTMKASKFREAARNTVRVLLAVLRLPRLETDILLTFNAPLELHPASSSVNALLHASDGPLAMRRFLAALQSFRVRDWSLFGPFDAYPAGSDGAASGGGDEDDKGS